MELATKFCACERQETLLDRVDGVVNGASHVLTNVCIATST
jgi:hypothetical protein